MFYYTYVLDCQNSDNIRTFYVGYCQDLKARLQDHLSHSVHTTKKYNKIKLIYYEACLSKTDAMKRETQLKTGYGRGYLKKRLSTYTTSRD